MDLSLVGISHLWALMGFFNLLDGDDNVMVMLFSIVVTPSTTQTGPASLQGCKGRHYAFISVE
jgi:hypothetical protein